MRDWDCDLLVVVRTTKEHNNNNNSCGAGREVGVAGLHLAGLALLSSEAHLLLARHCWRHPPLGGTLRVRLTAPHSRRQAAQLPAPRPGAGQSRTWGQQTTGSTSTCKIMVMLITPGAPHISHNILQ